MPGSLLSNDVLYISHIDSSNGLISFGITRKRGADNVTDSGSLASIAMQVAAASRPGDMVAMSFVDFTANDSDGNKLNIYAEDFDIKIGSTTGLPTIQPIDFALHQNYPNPFNPGTWIEFDIDQQTEVNLDIYNSLGQKIKTLVSEKLGQNNYSYYWNGTDESGAAVASGIYIYRLTTGEKVAIKKMVLLR
jgi:hypothetical protein